jgi:SAM-dependent methyltransferase
MTTISPSLEQILASWKRGALSSPLALMEMLICTKDCGTVARFLAENAAHGHEGRHDELRQMLVDNADGCAKVAEIARGDAPIRDVADVKVLFDRAVDACQEASVALYSLGNAAILETATEEIVAFLEREGLLGGDRRVLDLGSGIGRLEVALSPRVHSLVGIDVSPNMVSVARGRTSHLANVRIELGSGFELPFADGVFDLALAVDSMPYVVGLGDHAILPNFEEIARVLRPGGDFVILEFSYREDRESDCRDVARLADRFGFEVIVNGSSPFTVWSGRAFRLRRDLASAEPYPQK